MTAQIMACRMRKLVGRGCVTGAQAASLFAIWRSLCTSISCGGTPSSPLLILPSHVYGSKKDEEKKKGVVFEFFSPSQNKIVKQLQSMPDIISNATYVGSSNGWLGFVDRDDCRFYLADLLSSDSPIIIELPPIQSLPGFTYVQKKGNDTYSHYFTQLNRREGEKYTFTPDKLSDTIIHKFAISQKDKYDDECLVMISHSLGSDLAFCKIGDAQWSKLETEFEKYDYKIRPFNEIYYSPQKKCFFTSTEYRELVIWDLNDPKKPESHKVDLVYHHTPPKMSGLEELEFQVHLALRYRTDYFVETPQGDFLHVVRYYADVDKDGSFLPRGYAFCAGLDRPYRTGWFDVFKLNFDDGSAETVTNLGDTVLFVGFNESFVVSARDHPGLKSNSIYYADDFETGIFSEERHCACGGHDIGIYDFKDHSSKPLLFPEFKMEKILPPPVWVSKL